MTETRLVDLAIAKMISGSAVRSFYSDRDHILRVGISSESGTFGEFSFRWGAVSPLLNIYSDTWPYMPLHQLLFDRVGKLVTERGREPSRAEVIALLQECGYCDSSLDHIIPASKPAPMSLIRAIPSEFWPILQRPWRYQVSITPEILTRISLEMGPWLNGNVPDAYLYQDREAWFINEDDAALFMLKFCGNAA